MKKFMKLYWPMIISILLFIVYGMLIGVMVSSEALFENDAVGIGIVILTLLLVIGVYGGIIYFIIHAVKNKKGDERMWWCIGIYFLNVFLMPYYNLKCVCKEKNIKTKMLVFTGISILSFVIGLAIPISVDSRYHTGPLYIVEDDVKIKFSSSYRETEVGEYDIYAKDSKRNINFGVFIYDEDDNETAEEVMLSRDRWIKTSREKVTMLREFEEELYDRIITTNIYVATNNGVRNMYYISTVEFKNSDVFVNALGVNLYEDYLDYNGEFKQILVDMEYIGANQM